MIKAHELRIGNLVLVDGVVNTVIGLLMRHGVSVYIKTPQGNTISDDPENISPIPLTEEWLERFGFEKKPGPYYSNGFIDVWLDGGNSILICDACDSISGPDIKYIHQLQNLYFALTGEELKIKE